MRLLLYTKRLAIPLCCLHKKNNSTPIISAKSGRNAIVVAQCYDEAAHKISGPEGADDVDG